MFQPTSGQIPPRVGLSSVSLPQSRGQVSISCKHPLSPHWKCCSNMAASARLNQSFLGQRDLDTLEMGQAEQRSPKKKCTAGLPWKKTKLPKSRCSSNWLQTRAAEALKGLYSVIDTRALTEKDPRLGQLALPRVPQSQLGIHSWRHLLFIVN